MADQTSVANLALMFIGSETRLLSIDDEKDAARSLKSVWDIERQAFIRSNSWNWATQRHALPAQAISVPPPYAFSYRLPALAIRLISVLDGTGRDEISAYQQEGRSILTNVGAPLHVKCLMDVPEIAEWDPLAAQIFAGKLALTCGQRIAGSAFDRDLTLRRIREASSDAKSIDAMENPPIEQEESSWVTSRFRGGYHAMGRPGWEII